LNRLWDWIEGRDIPALQGHGWNQGTATGYLLPCNLTVGTHLLNTAIAPNLSNVILAMEDVGETPYRIDRMLTQWRMTGALHQVKGIAIGRFSQAESPSHIPSFSMEEVFRDRLSDLGIPIVSDLPFGHDGENAILPVGVSTTLDSDLGTLTITRH
ncbi:MAG: LD-carboxypeptidase, partial [Acaryochloridaceae cyanobacterium RL_2_7]|nr:LD-carboxypeptidase [Acaryochloridaceae cyanobacterium RL_2_7]